MPKLFAFFIAFVCISNLFAQVTGGPEDGCACNYGFLKNCANSCEAPDVCCQKDYLEGTAPFMEIVLESSAASSSAKVRFYKNATQGYDTLYDAQRFANAALGIYSFLPAKDLIINTLPFAGKEVTVPLRVKATNKGAFTLRLGGMERLPETVKITLIDNEKKTSTNLRLSVYTFSTTDLLDSPSRFELLLENLPADNALAILTQPASATAIIAFPNPAEDQLVFDLRESLAEPLKLTLFSLQGQALYQETTYVSGTQFILDLPKTHILPGTYYVRLDAAQRHYQTRITLQ